MVAATRSGVYCPRLASQSPAIRLVRHCSGSLGLGVKLVQMLEGAAERAKIGFDLVLIRIAHA